MISDKHKCIFVHLRRTGGNSIEVATGGIVLLDRSGAPTMEWDNNLHRGHNIPHKLDYRGHYMHDSAQAIREQFPEKFKQYNKFSIVRNPWEQMISLYLRLHSADKDAKNFKNWLSNYSEKDAVGTVPFYSIFDKRRKAMVDEIGRYENLESDFLTICQKFNIEAKSLPETNASGKQHYSQYYDRDSAELVARIYKRDLKHFGYRFERA